MPAVQAGPAPRADPLLAPGQLGTVRQLPHEDRAARPQRLAQPAHVLAHGHLLGGGKEGKDVGLALLGQEGGGRGEGDRSVAGTAAPHRRFVLPEDQRHSTGFFFTAPLLAAKEKEIKLC